MSGHKKTLALRNKLEGQSAISSRKVRKQATVKQTVKDGMILDAADGEPSVNNDSPDELVSYAQNSCPSTCHWDSANIQYPGPDLPDASHLSFDAYYCELIGDMPSPKDASTLEISDSTGPGLVFRPKPVTLAIASAITSAYTLPIHPCPSQSVDQGGTLLLEQPQPSSATACSPLLIYSGHSQPIDHGETIPPKHPRPQYQQSKTLKIQSCPFLAQLEHFTSLLEKRDLVRFDLPKIGFNGLILCFGDEILFQRYTFPVLALISLFKELSRLRRRFLVGFKGLNLESDTSAFDTAVFQTLNVLADWAARMAEGYPGSNFNIDVPRRYLNWKTTLSALQLYLSRILRTMSSSSSMKIRRRFFGLC